MLGDPSVVTREAHERSLAELRAEIADPAAGILGPESAAWTLGGDLSVFLGGGRAALLQLAHPMVAYAIDQHSKTREDVLGRFQRTFRNVFAMVFGDLDDAIAAARRVHKVHAHIAGEIPIALGRYAAGARYHANDVGALRWVHATLVDTTLVVLERTGRAPRPRDADRYVTEMNRFAQLFGIPRALHFGGRGELAAYLAEMVASDAIAVAPVAREMASFLVGKVPGAPQPPLGRLTEAITAELLPPPLADAFGLRATPRLVRGGLRGIGLGFRALPRAVTTIPAHSEARRRLRGLAPSPIAAWTERRLFGLARNVSGPRASRGH